MQLISFDTPLTSGNNALEKHESIKKEASISDTL